MMQVAHVLLLVFSLLVCPMRCLGALAGGESLVQSQPKACACCGPVEQQQPAAPSGNDRRPENPEDDCGCGNCLCHGVTVDGASVGVADSGAFSYVTPLLGFDACSPSRLLRTAPHCQHSCHFPPFVTGRDVCALTCTLLL